MSINWINIGYECLPTQEAINKLEHDWRVKLPALYKLHLLNHAGHRPENVDFHFQKNPSSPILHFDFIDLCHLNDSADYEERYLSVQHRKERYVSEIDSVENPDIDDLSIWPISWNGSRGGFFFDFREGNINPRIGYWGGDAHFLDPSDTDIFPQSITYEKLINSLV